MKYFILNYVLFHLIMLKQLIQLIIIRYKTNYNKIPLQLKISAYTSTLNALSLIRC